MSTFVLKRNYELQLPTSFVDIDRAEMEYVDGGDYSFSISAEFLNKTNCLNMGRRLLSWGLVTGMTLDQVQEEIYAHAVAYYYASALKQKGIDNAVVNYLIARGRTVELTNGGDTWVRKVGYSQIWKMF